MFRKMASSNYVLVALQKSNEQAATLAHFTDSVLGALCGGAEVGCVYARVDKNRLIVSQKPQCEGDRAVRIKRPSFCPMHNLSSEQAASLDEATRTRGINSGAAVLLETADNKVLLTRRALTLRSFPGVWVPPGGHIDAGETFTEAALREMKEEAGLAFTSQDFESINQLAMWESVYPTKLSIGLPRRHHVVCYIHARLTAPHTAEALTARLQPSPAEVGACTWLDRQMVRAIVAADEEDGGGQREVDAALPEKFRATVISPDGASTEEWLDTRILTSTCQGGQTDTERVSTGTKFALSQLLATTS